MNQDEDKTNDNEDDFGLPDMDYDPLENKEENGGDDNAYESDNYNFPDDENKKSNTPLIVGIIVGVILLVAVAFSIYNFYVKPRAQEEKNKIELAKKQRIQEREKIIAQEKLDRKKEEEKKSKEDSIKSLNSKNNFRASTYKSSGRNSGRIAGQSVEIITGRTGMYHVVVSSGIDDDLLMDYAKKLTRKGVSTKIIPPYGNTKFYRLVIAQSHGKLSKAQEQLKVHASDYGSNVWVLKY